MAGEILCWKPYSCFSALKPSKGKSVGDGKVEYDFDISKVDKIFLSSDKRPTIWLNDGHNYLQMN